MKGLTITRGASKAAYNFTPSVVAWRLLHLNRDTPSGTKTLQEVERARGCVHDSCFQETVVDAP